MITSTAGNLAAGAITPDLVARHYPVAESDVLEFVAFPPANALRITLRRPVPAGAAGDADVYGAQQHAPLLGMVLELPP